MNKSLDTFFKGSKNGFYGNALENSKTYVPQVGFMWEVNAQNAPKHFSNCILSWWMC